MMHNITLICFYGPESTGKSTMATEFAREYHTTYVPEVAREMITSNQFDTSAIIQIGRAHYERILEKLAGARNFLFVDTDAITTQIYSRHYLNEVPQDLFELEAKITYDHYFLFKPDVPWVVDGLRDLGHLREEMMELFRAELVRRGIAYTLVQGNFEERAQIIRDKLTALCPDYLPGNST